MRDYVINITREEYEKMASLSYEKCNEIVERKLPHSILFGYGYYGYNLVGDIKNNHYYIICHVGNGCD